jgi:response regulator of citrate/malate metabolism
MKLPIPIALPAERSALARLYIDLSMAFRATIPNNKRPTVEPDANRTLIAVAVMLGHAEGHAMTETEIASCVQMPRQSVHRRLEALVESGLIVRCKHRYYLEPGRALNVPHKDKFDLPLAQAFEVLGPYLLKLGE